MCFWGKYVERPFSCKIQNSTIACFNICPSPPTSLLPPSLVTYTTTHTTPYTHTLHTSHRVTMVMLLR